MKRKKAYRLLLVLLLGVALLAFTIPAGQASAGMAKTGSSRGPFVGVYSYPPEDQPTDWGTHVNLLLGFHPNSTTDPLITRPEDLEYWKKRGAYAAGWVLLMDGPVAGTVTTPVTPPGQVGTGEQTKFRQLLEERVAQGYNAIGLEVERSMDAQDVATIAAFKAAHPDILVVAMIYENYVIQQDWSSIGPVVDLFLLESYSYLKLADFGVDDNYVAILRQYGLTSKSLIGILTTNKNAAQGGATFSSQSQMPTPGAIEREIKHIRRIAPEMPGVWFYYHNSDPMYVPPENLKAANDASYKYFVPPVLTVRQQDIKVSKDSPKPGQPVKISVSIRNIGYTDAKGLIVSFYDGDPTSGGTFIGQAAIDVPAQGDGVASLTTRFVKGVHDVYPRFSGPEVTLLDIAHRPVLVGIPWWNKAFPYRLPLWTADAPFDREDALQQVPLDLSAYEKDTRVSKPIDPGSLRLAEYDRAGDPVGEVPVQFQAALQGQTPTAGVVTWVAGGNIPAGTTRYYYLYFASAGTPDLPPPISRTVKKEAWTFTTSHYSLGLDPSRGFVISNLVPANSQANVIGDAAGWGFTIGLGQDVLTQDGLGAAVTPLVEQGPVFTTVSFEALLGDSSGSNKATLVTRYTLYADSPLIKVERKFVPQGSAQVSNAYEYTFYSATNVRPGTYQYQLGFSDIAFSGQLLQGVATDPWRGSYFFGSLYTPDMPHMPKPAAQHRDGWFDFSWTESLNAGLGVVVGKRWEEATFPYPNVDMTGYYEAEGSTVQKLQVVQTWGGTVAFSSPQTSAIYLLPHNWRDLQASSPAPAHTAWVNAAVALEVTPGSLEWLLDLQP